MTDIGTLGLLTAAGAGAVSFLSPCVLPLVPPYVSYVTGQSVLHPGAQGAPRASRADAAFLGVCFVLGFSTVFIALGASATLLGQLLFQFRAEAAVAGGVLVMLFGVVMLVGAERIPFLRRELRFDPRVATGNAGSAYLLGLAFGFGWTPCVGPILGVILTAAAVSDSAGAGIGMLAAYSAGLGIPFILSALFLHEMTGRWRPLRKAGRPLMVGAGAVMVVMGLAMATGMLSVASYWLLEQFPALGRLG